MKLGPTTSGTFAIAPTPFHPDGRIDDASIDRMTDFYLEVGCAGITVLGIMGEAPKLEDNPSCEMLKHEDWPGLDKITALRGFQKDGSMRPISILTGNGALFLDFEMERGADGAMTGYAFPDMLVDLVRLAGEGRREAAHDLFDAHLPLIRYEQQQGVGLAVRKYVMMRRGIIASDAQRKPGSSLSAPGKAEVDYLLSRLARVDKRAELRRPEPALAS